MDKRRDSLIMLLAAVALLALGVVLGGIITTSKSVEAQTAPTTGQNDQHGITVSGTGIVNVSPDEAIVVVGVTERDTTVQAAQQKANTEINAITKAITDLKITPDNIKTQSFNISPFYNNNSSTPELQGYVVEEMLQIKVQPVDLVGKVIDAATGAGANQIGNIQFTLADSATALKQARQAAMSDASTKASQLASNSGFQVGGVVGVTEISSNTQPQPVVRAAAGVAAGSAASVPTNIQSGTYQVEVDVQVTYAVK